MTQPTLTPVRAPQGPVAIEQAARAALALLTYGDATPEDADRVTAQLRAALGYQP